MAKIAFMGAGSTVFVKSIIGDMMCTEALKDSEVALYDIDPVRLRESQAMLEVLSRNLTGEAMKIKSYLGVARRKDALRGASYVVNAIQVGGYEPSTVIDFEIPKKYGIRQTIADTLGIGGIFRALRTIPVMLDFARDMEEVCPDAWLLNYSNPMSMLTGAILSGSGVKMVGLCHSVQGCARSLIGRLSMDKEVRTLRWSIAGINHMAWLLELKDGGKDIYPAVRRRAERAVARVLSRGSKKVLDEARKEADRRGVRVWEVSEDARVAHDLVRLEIMRHFGYYVTESSEHNAEYMPYWIKSGQPGLVERYNIPLDEYPRRCVAQIAGWRKQSAELLKNKDLSHKRSIEYGSYIIEAMETDKPFRIHGSVMNKGIITNLPAKACVEVPCMVDRNGVNPCHVGALPEQCAALNMTNVNVHILVVEAALTLKRDKIYQAAFMDPHTSAELNLDQIRSLCDDLIKAHGRFLPRYK